jgi:hypothetical protein
VSNVRSELRWGVEQRLEFIEFRLFWEGHVNRSDVMTQFGLSVTASAKPEGWSVAKDSEGWMPVSASRSRQTLTRSTRAGAGQRPRNGSIPSRSI